MPDEAERERELEAFRQALSRCGGLGHGAV